MKVELKVKTPYVLFVSLTLEQIVEEARHWPLEKVGELVGRLSEGLHASTLEIETARKAEINRRIEEIQSGKAKGFPVKKYPRGF